MRRGDIACVVITILVIAICVASGMEARDSAQKAQLEKSYARAEALIQGGEYAEALEVLEGLEESYRNVQALTCYSRAHIQRSQGKLEDALKELEQCDAFQAFDEEMPEGYEAFRAEVAEELARYEQEERRKEEEAYQERVRKEEEAYQERVRRGVPFVGMRESDIANTILGTPSSNVRHNYDMVNGKPVEANLYDFYQNGRRIFTARCMYGSVKQVWDERGKAAQPKKRSSGKSTPRKEEDDDPLNAKDYRFPEDFYEDHWDDFFDFYDAEDYYYEHGGR